MYDDYKAVAQDVELKAKEYENKLQEIINIENSDKSPLTKNLICNTLRQYIIQEYTEHFGRDLSKLISTHLQILRTANNTIDSEDDEFILREFLKRDMSLDWLIPSICTLGSLYLFAAKAKTGKTDFMNYLASRITIPNLKFLGFPCRKGTVLYVQVEESNANIRLKAKQHGYVSYYAQDKEHNAFDVIVLRSLDLINDFHKLEQKIEKYKPIVVIIDTLRGVTFKSGQSEIEASFANVLYPVQFLSIQKNFTTFVLHHTNKTKSNEGDDPLDRVSGTSKLVTIGDGTIVYSRNTDNTINMEFVTRDIGRRTLVLQRMRDKKRRIYFEIIKELGVSPASLNLTNKILLLLKLHGKLTESEIALHLKSNVGDTLDRLCEHFLIDYEENKEDLIYFIPKDSIHLWEGILDDDDLKTIDLAYNLTQSNNAEDIKKIGENHTKEEKVRALQLLPDVDKLEVWKTRFPPKYKGKLNYKNQIWMVNVENLLVENDMPIYLYRLCSMMGEAYPELIPEHDLDEHIQQPS